MTVLAYAKQDKVKGWHGLLEYLSHRSLVLLGACLRRDLATHTMNVCRGNSHPVQKGIPGQPVVAVLMVWRYTTLVAPEDVPAVPSYLFGVGRRSKSLIEQTRGATARKSHSEAALSTGTIFGHGSNVFRGGLCSYLSRGQDVYINHGYPSGRFPFAAIPGHPEREGRRRLPAPRSPAHKCAAGVSPGPSTLAAGDQRYAMPLRCGRSG